MAGRQPFTALCQKLGRKAPTRVDLHIHTTCSDGTYTPAQVVELARRCGMPALAITDHDTVAGVLPARLAANDDLEVITGIEITAHHNEQTIHLLGYFFDPEHPALVETLQRLRAIRTERFREMVQRLKNLGIDMDGQIEEAANSDAPGRRHLAELMVESGQAGSVKEAFYRFLKDGGQAAVPYSGLPAEEAIGLIRAAGGVTSWAHPPKDGTVDYVRDLCDLGLQAVEVEFPGCRPRRSRELRTWASLLGLAVTGGSDCHGAADSRREIGAGGVNLDELENLRDMISSLRGLPARGVPQF